MNPSHEPPLSIAGRARDSFSLAGRPTIAHAIGWVVVAAIAYAIWRGYQNPDLLLDLAAMRLC